MPATFKPAILNFCGDMPLPDPREPANITAEDDRLAHKSTTTTPQSGSWRQGGNAAPPPCRYLILRAASSATIAAKHTTSQTKELSVKGDKANHRLWRGIKSGK